MTLSELEQALFACWPRRYSASWDNVGLQAGDPSAPVRRALVSLDVTDAVADEAARLGADCIISHHPLLFTPLRSVLAGGPGGLVYRLVRSGVGVISMHTNLDSAPGGLADRFALQFLPSVTGVFGAEPDRPDVFYGRMGGIAPVPLSALLDSVRARLGGPLRYAGDPARTVSVLALLCGAGRDYIDEAARLGADAYITADLGYHAFQRAVELGLAVVDAGPYQTEQCAPVLLAEAVRRAAPAVEIIASAQADVIRFHA